MLPSRYGTARQVAGSTATPSGPHRPNGTRSRSGTRTSAVMAPSHKPGHMKHVKHAKPVRHGGMERAGVCFLVLPPWHTHDAAVPRSRRESKTPRGRTPGRFVWS
ncbi:hypothetical protein Aph01nite_75860 [Acrocarpospora phusangensis]|uniref:Uncharacterized protein n=1 Tax=Acrocarpospora phusangensis TaxID=1070424 RepID=A0A919QI60_9ACTN|nr:hypothetical protein Aph01nite_75860 [Acrocarpospora phusangensis]